MLCRVTLDESVIAPGNSNLLILQARASARRLWHLRMIPQYVISLTHATVKTCSKILQVQTCWFRKYCQCDKDQPFLYERRTLPQILDDKIPHWLLKVWKSTSSLLFTTLQSFTLPTSACCGKGCHNRMVQGTKWYSVFPLTSGMWISHW